jgi:parallel beta helix pectate lyase-like protein
VTVARILLVAAALAILTFAPAAHADHVRCGDVLVQDTRLDSDVVCPPDTDGLTIGADDVTLDLRRHVISGNGDDLGPIAVGIQATGRTGLSIRNGTVTGFSVGVSLAASGSEVRDLIVDGGSAIIVNGDDNVVRRSEASGSFDAISVTGSSAVVERNTASAELAINVAGSDPRVSRNVITECVIVGIQVTGYTDAHVHRNLVERGCIAGFEFRGAGARVERNTALGSDIGLDITDSSAIVSRNVASFGVEGLVTRTPGTTVARNTANHNASWGIDAPGAIDGGGNRATGNGEPAQCLGVRCR